MSFRSKDKEMADKLDKWVREAVHSIGAENTRLMLEVMLQFDFSKVPKEREL